MGCCSGFQAAAAAATIGPWLVLVLLACGAIEVGVRLRDSGPGPLSIAPVPLVALGSAGLAALPALMWVALKVGALSYGGGFVIIPLMQNDAVNVHHWMTGGQFLSAVALGQITPGPVVQTVAVVGYAAAGIFGGVLAALIAFSPSFAFVLIISTNCAPVPSPADSSTARARPRSVPSWVPQLPWRRP